MRKICFVAQFPPPIHGLSKAVDTLYKSSLSSIYDFTKIDIKDNTQILQTIIKILTIKTDLFYFTISQTIWGNIRDLLLLALFKLRRKKCVIHLHGGYYRNLIDHDCGFLQRKLNYILVSRVDKAIVLSESLKCIFDGILPQEKVIVVGNGVDKQFLPTVIEKHVRTEKLNLVYLSNFIKEKGYVEVLEVANSIKEKGLEDKFCFCFAGKFYSELDFKYFNQYIKEHQLVNVEYHGVVLGDKKNELLLKGHIFFLLTKYPNEGQPISLLEAMGNGMAIITTNHAGIPDIVTNERGLICDVNNINIHDITNYLIKCYQDRQYLKIVGEQNHKYIQEFYTEDIYIDNMGKVFNDVMI